MYIQLEKCTHRFIKKKKNNNKNKPKKKKERKQKKNYLIKNTAYLNFLI